MVSTKTMQYLPSMFLVNKIKFLFVLFLSLFFKNKANKKINFIYIFFMHANYHTCCILCVCGHVHVQLLALVSQDTAWIALRDVGEFADGVYQLVGIWGVFLTIQTFHQAENDEHQLKSLKSSWTVCIRSMKLK